MTKKNYLIKFFVVSILAFILSSCYEFSEAPFKDSDLIKLSDTKFGKEVIESFDNIPNNQFTMEMKSGFSDEIKVYEISNDYLISQEFKDNKWTIGVYTKNDNHMMFCSLMENENLENPTGIIFDIKDDGMGKTYLASGEQENLEKLALNLVNTTPKVCIAIPFGIK
tara:strand:- start:232 stop:732 length:501 start_codon:yes stop_codon:yes gene_type:complete